MFVVTPIRIYHSGNGLQNLSLNYILLNPILHVHMKGLSWDQYLQNSVYSLATTANADLFDEEKHENMQEDEDLTEFSAKTLTQFLFIPPPS